MRTQTGAESTLLAGNNYGVYLRAFVKNGSGTFKDLSSLSGFNWLQEAILDLDIDQPTAQSTITLRRDASSTLSLAPLRTDSTLNRLDDGSTYSPLLEIGREIYWEAAVTAIGSSPVSADWKELFRGYIDSVDVASPAVTVTARDLGGVLVDRWIENKAEYGFDTAMETVMQTILDDVLGPATVTLYTPVSPSFLQRTRPQAQEPLMDALLAFARDQIGWDVRYKWDSGTSTWRLTLYQPDRTKSVPDRTFGPSTYYKVDRMVINRADVRNVIDVTYPVGTTGARARVTAADTNSITKYGRRYIGIDEATDSSVDTAAEATTLANAILSDLKDPKAEQEIEAQFFWPAELGDLYRFSANAVHYNTDQDWAVTNIRHSLTAMGTGRTTLQVRGKPAGGYLSWTGLPFHPPIYPHDIRPWVEGEDELRNFRPTSDTPTQRTYGWTNGPLVSEVWGASLTFGTPLPADPWALVKVAVLPLALGATSFIVEKPAPGSGLTLFGQVEPRLSDYSVGVARRFTIEAEPPDLPAIETDDDEIASLGTVWLKIRPRGMVVTNVQAQTQVGNEAISAFVAPTRSSGATSVVKGGVLGASEYEHDVARHANQSSWITFKLTLETGEIVTVGPVSFDPNPTPNIMLLSVSGTILTVVGDSDTDSWKLRDKNGTWEYKVDGFSAVVDVSKPGTNGAAGIGAGSSWTVEVTAYSKPVAQQADAGVLTMTQDVQVGNASTEPTWDHVSAQAPNVGSAVATVKLDASSAPGGYTAKVFQRSRSFIDGVAGSWSAFADITSQLTPALSAPPTAQTAYSYTTDTQRGSDPRFSVTFEFRCEIRNAANVVVTTQTVSASWLYDLGL